MMHLTAFHVAFLSGSVWSHHIPSDVESMNICVREPPRGKFERNPGDGGFKITVNDDLHLKQYIPERLYRISITGTALEHTLSGAYLEAVPYNSSVKNATVGRFHLVDGGRLAFHVTCSDIVTTVDSLPKAEVYVMWLSPVRQTGCVEFRATVIQDQVWYKNDGALTKVLCAEEAGDRNTENVHTPDISSKVDCCACGTAKYQLTFRSLWSRSIHLDHSPDVNKSVFHWSPVVGSSHSKHYTMWHFSTLASQGVSDLCQFGDTRTLEDEIRHQSSNIRTVIKTPGIQWTKERGLQQQRWAHFSVDRRHHLLSVLSRLSPSPDWCVGVSAFDLCLDNCTWLADTSIWLFAWDAGVSNGDSYASENRQSYLAQPIHRLTARAHDNPGLPFRSGKPADSMAVLRLHRFDPNLDDDNEMCSNTVAKDQGMTKIDDLASEINHTHHNSCIMGSWSRWSRCSATCGSGTRTRTRTAVVATVSCADLLQTMSKPCKTADCVALCELREWSEWSACSNGFVRCSSDDPYIAFCSRRRNRFFRHPGAEAFCNDTVDDEEPCQPSDTGIFAAFNTEIMSKCFSPADSGPCKGNILRWYYDTDLNGCRTFLYGGCRGNANRYPTEGDCVKACRQYKGNVIQTNADDSAKTDIGTTRSISKASAEAKESDYGTPDSNVVTTLAYAVDCVMSPWSAWSGCSITCGRNGVRTRLRTVRWQPSGGGRKCPRRKLRRRRCSMPVCTTECQYTEWSPWSPCARSCGADTVQERIQRVQGSLSRRSQCPVKLQRRLCALPQCFKN